VLTGAIALQAMFIPATSAYAPAGVDQPRMYVSMPGADLRTAFLLEDTLRKVPGASRVDAGAFAEVRNGNGGTLGMFIGTCDDLRHNAAITSCRDGDVFAVDPPFGGSAPVPTAGQQVTLESFGAGTTKVAQWTVPTISGTLRPQPHGQATEGAALYATPAALAGIAFPVDVEATVQLGASDDVVVQRVRNALVPYGWRATAFSGTTVVSGTFWLIDKVLSIGSVITLLLAAASLVVVALEQIRERRRALAVLTANGVRRSVLARSLLWQSAVPIAVAVVVALVIGLTLTALLFYVAGQPLVLDWSTIALFVGTAVVAVLASTGCTLPSLWRAASVEGLRDE
jgi:hypothetical protein